jgi:hypothetical protein
VVCSLLYKQSRTVLGAAAVKVANVQGGFRAMAYISRHGPRSEDHSRGLLSLIFRALFLGSILALVPLLTAAAWLGVSAGADLRVVVGFFLSFWGMVVATLGCLAHVTRDENGLGEEYDFHGHRRVKQRVSSR